MTEKRFRFGGNTHIIDTETNGEYYAPCEEELLDLLNSLSNENEQLKEQIKELEKNSFLCLDCEYCRNVEIGCLCDHNDNWVEFVTECDDFKKELYE